MEDEWDDNKYSMLNEFHEAMREPGIGEDATEIDIVEVPDEDLYNL